MTTQQIETALLVLADFYDTDEESRADALDVASKCMRAVLRIMEGDTDDQ